MRQVRTHKTFTCWTWNTETSPVQWVTSILLLMALLNSRKKR